MTEQQRLYTPENPDDGAPKIIHVKIQMRVLKRYYTWESGWECSKDYIPENLYDVVRKMKHLR